MKKYCMNCMREVTTGTLCADCVNLQIADIAPHHLKPGTVLRERYLIGNVIGEGGFGITYIGRDLVLDTKVAVKEFYPAGHVNRNHAVTDELTISTDQQREFVKAGVERFLDEARKAAQFSEESGIVNVRDFFEANATAYMVMEYLDGRTLADYIRENGPMDAGKVFRLIDRDRHCSWKNAQIRCDPSGYQSGQYHVSEQRLSEADGFRIGTVLHGTRSGTDRDDQKRICAGRAVYGE